MAARQDGDGVEVEGGDLVGVAVGDLAEADQQVGQRGTVGGRLAAQAGEQAREFAGADQTVRRAGIERQQV